MPHNLLLQTAYVEVTFKTTAFRIIISTRPYRSANSFRRLLPCSITYLLLQSSSRCLAPLVARMATSPNLRTGQCDSLPMARRKTRQSEPRLSSHSIQCWDSPHACPSQRRVTDYDDTLRTGQAMCDGARVNPICLRALRSRSEDERIRKSAMGAVQLGHTTTRRVQSAILPPYMCHEMEMDGLCKTSQDQQKALEAPQEADETTGSTAKTPQSTWQRQMFAQGPWDENNDPDFLEAFQGEPRFRPPKPFSRLEGCDIPKLLSDLANSGFGRHVPLPTGLSIIPGTSRHGSLLATPLMQQFSND